MPATHGSYLPTDPRLSKRSPYPMPDLSIPRYSATSTRYRNHAFRPVLGLAPSIHPSKSLPELHSAEQAEQRQENLALDKLASSVAAQAARAVTPPTGSHRASSPPPGTRSPRTSSPPTSPSSRGGGRRLAPRERLSPVAMRPLTSPADPRAGGAVQGYDEWFGETARSPGRPGWSAPRDIKPMPFARPSAHPADGGQVASLRARVEQLVSKLHADTHAFRAEKRALRSAAESAQRLRVKAEVGQAQAEAEAAWARAELDRVRSSVDAERSQAEAATRALASELNASRTELARYREEVAKQAGALEALHALIETQGLFLPPPHARGEPGNGKPGNGHGNGLPASPYPPRAQARRRRTSGDRDVDDEDDSWETSDEGVTRLRRIAEEDEDAARAAEEMAERSPPTGRGPVEAAPAPAPAVDVSDDG